MLDLLARGEITAQVAARFPLSQAAAALTYTEAGGYIGKVIIVPDAELPNGTAISPTKSCRYRTRPKPKAYVA